MINADDPKSDEESQPSSRVSEDDRQAISERSSGSARVVHEVVRLQGDEELDRPIRSLLFSGFAAGVAICTSLLAEAFLHMRLPEAPWRELIVPIGYTIGFMIVILGNLQLFTETTVTAVLPLATHPTRRNLHRLLRLWVAVFMANMAGTLIVAALIANQIIVGPDQLTAALEVSRSILRHDFTTTLLLATPAGFLIASIAWILPCQGQRVLGHNPDHIRDRARAIQSRGSWSRGSLAAHVDWRGKFHESGGRLHPSGPRWQCHRWNWLVRGSSPRPSSG